MRDAANLAAMMTKTINIRNFAIFPLFKAVIVVVF
jgi:hypothetical protein